MVGTQGTLRRAGIVAAVVAALAFLAAASAGAAPLALIGNATGKSVSVINTQTNKTVGEPIELKSEAGGIAIVPGGPAYVAETEKEAVAVINPTTGKKLTSIPVGKRPEFLAVSPDGKNVWVADREDEDVALIETATNTSPGSVPVGGEPRGLALTPNGKLLYVSVGNTLVTIDTVAQEIVGKPIPVGQVPRLIAFSPDGSTAYVTEEISKAVAIVDTTSRQEVGSIPIPGTNPLGLAISPEGKTLYVGNDAKEGTVTAFNTVTRNQLGGPIKVGERPIELALTPSGKTLYVTDFESNQVTPIETESRKALTPIELPGLGPAGIAITPDLSPTAAFTVTSINSANTATFDGRASTDPDGTVNRWFWAFGDGDVASEFSSNLGTSAVGPYAEHRYPFPGTYPASVAVFDNEGCGIEPVFTGRTAYCSGNPGAKVTHPVVIAGPPAPAPVCSTNFAIGGVSHNRKNGTVRLRLRFYSTGSFLIFGQKIHAVTRKVRKTGTAVVTLHARVELNKRLKKTHRAGVRYRVTFTPSAGCGSKTVHRSVALLRAPRKKHR